MQLSKIEIAIIAFIVVFSVTLGYFEKFIGSESMPAEDVFPHQISSIDTAIMLKVNPSIMNPTLNLIFETLTHLGSILAIVFFGIFLYVIGHKREAVLVLATIVIGVIIIAPLKIIVHRPRPYLTIHEVIPLEIESGTSFPSGHAERAFALASVLSDRRLIKLTLYVYAFLIAFSRVYIGVHYPLDVIAGSIIGWVVGKLTLRMEGRIMSFVYKVKK